MSTKRKSILSADLMVEALKASFAKLVPQAQFRNPVLFVTYLGAIFTTILTFYTPSFFNVQLALWLWFTVLFANFASSIAESRGKAQAASLRKTQTENMARKLVDGKEVTVSALDLRKGDRIICEVGDIIPADGEVVEGIATVDESAITGESAPVIRESGGDRSAVTAGTRIVSDQIEIEVTSEKGHSFLDRMIGLIEGAKRQKTPNEIALSIVLSALTIIFLLTVMSLKSFANYSSIAAHQDLSDLVTLPVLIALLVCLIPTTISALLSAIGIAGMDRLIQRNVIAKSGRAVEAAGDIDLLILDKTGTITLGNRMATEFLPAPGIDEKEFAKISQLASLSDETPEGRSIVVLAKNRFNLRAEALHSNSSLFVPFSAQSRMSGIDFTDMNGNVVRMIRKGAVDAIQKHIEIVGGVFPIQLKTIIESISNKGGTPLLVSDGNQIVGVVHLKDIIKGGIKERFAEMRKIGIKTLMVTGDNPLTAGAIAAEAGVDDFVAQATPEMKLARIREEQKKGHLIAMTGDGTNDAPALAQADVGVAMNTGTQASREAGNMVDLDSNPTKLLDIVEIGKQLLMTRGALTTFSIANDVAKYFAIIPAVFGSLYALSGQEGPLNYLNIMHLQSPQSAILSAVIFNALIIVALIPLALKGIPYKPQPAGSILRHHLFVYGLGGIIAPFIGIKLIDLLINALGLVS
ncbi:Potassium-transporting ATPase B chain [Candidatus Protochlamydia naegleriophila]|uniref:Potassium-transporting ATPase ATP-binding subunit n=1 Tax=Candidatus Protochlamydia naegleriophila TaxID=389348 RepID=A0A0U5CSE1_9BACT|nr:potassium-transporting ATPase subunit KdpB [Candidatus Protochlamydia naegleriophila]CUI17948.1 Potassium-transporting ATPase B chain [Candidatus Protochlamydia naegleriophila]